MVRVSPPSAVRARSSEWVLLASSTTIGVLNYVYSLAVLHLLAPTEFAIFAFLSSLLLVVGTFSGAALPFALARQVANHRAGSTPRAEAISFTLFASAAASLVASAFIVALSVQFGSPGLVALSVLGCVAVFLGSTLNGYFQGKQQFHLLAAVGILEAVTKLVTGVVFVLLVPSAELAIASFAVGSLVKVPIGIWAMRRDLRFRWVPAGAARRLWADALRLGGLQALVSITVTVDVIVLGILAADSVRFAQYQAVLILARIPIFFSSSLSTIAFSGLADRSTEPREASALVSRSLGRYVLLAGIFAAGVSTAPSTYLDLVLPESYLVAQPLLLPLSFAGAAAGLLSLTSFYAKAIERYREMVILLGFTLVSAAVGVVSLASDATAVAWLMAVVMTIAAVGSLLVLRRVVPGARLPWLVGLIGPAATGVLVLARSDVAVWTVLSAVLVGGGALLFHRMR
jgi:O-antigen/teichoic acid export membrane protein